MEIIAGIVILKDNKLLMVREAKKECKGKWAFPAGHIEKNETIFDGAKRELLEETGCKAELKKVFPIIVHNTDRSFLMIHFLANLIEENTLNYNKNEIEETKWISIDEIKSMDKEDFRSYNVIKTVIDNLEMKKLYELDVFKNLEII